MFIFSSPRAQADSVLIIFPAALAGEESTGFGDSSGASLSGSLVRIGAFDTDPTSLMAGLALFTTPSDILTHLNARFTSYTSFAFSNAYLEPDSAIFPATDDDGLFLEAQPAIGTSLQGKDIYLLFYNAATANSATEVAIFRMKQDLLVDDPAGSTGIFSSGETLGQITASFNLSATDTDLLLGFYNSQTDTFFTGKLSGGTSQITSPLTETNASGAVSTYQITANNGADRFFATTNTASADLTLTNLPAGFSIATNTGVITAGTNAAANTYSIRLVASNSLTTSVATNTLIWTLQASTLSFTTTTNLISAVAGVEISPFTFVSSGTSPTYTADGNLRGLTLSTNGMLSGIPNSVGTNDVSITSSAGGQNGNTTFSLAVAAPTISVPAGELTGGQILHTAGTARTVTLSKTDGFTDLTGEVSPPTSGVSFNGTDLLIATDAVPLLKGTTNVTLTLTASRAVGGSTVSASTSVPLRIVAPAPTELVGPTEFEVDVGEAFSTTILSDAGTNGRMNFFNLPSGLVGYQNGIVAGTNSSTNLPYEFAVKVVADSTQIYEGGGTYTNTNVIFRLRNLNAPVITSGLFKLVGVGNPFSQYTIQASGTPVRFVARDLPSGLVLNGQNIQGTPTQAGNFNVSLEAYNSFRPGSTLPSDLQSGTATLRIFVSGSKPTAATPLSGSSSLQVGNPANFSLLSAQQLGLRVSGYGFPPGLSLNSSTGLVAGTPTAAGTYAVTVFIQNGKGWIKKAISLTVR